MRDYCLGLNWSYVEADCGCGVAFTARSGAKRTFKSDLRGKTLREVAELSKSWCFEEATLGIAALNAWYARRELLDPQFAPTGYLIRIASNAALAAIRRTRRTVPVDTTHPGFLALTDAQACARLHDSATPELIQDAMTQAYGQRDATAIRVATYLLDEIQRTGKAPSNRAAAQALGLSHEGVGKALRRLRTYLVASRRGY